MKIKLNHRSLIAIASLAALCATATASTLVYDNTGSVAFGFSSTDLNTVWGDAVTLDSPGVLDEIGFSVWNNDAASTLTDFSIELNIYDNSTPFAGNGETLSSWTPLATISGSGSTSLDPGYYSIFNFTGLASNNIVLPSDILITQKLTSVTGSSNVGVVFGSSDAVGTGTPDTFYLNNSDYPEDLYTFGTGNVSNVAYSVSVNAVPEPASLIGLGIGAAAMIRRRRKA